MVNGSKQFQGAEYIPRNEKSATDKQQRYVDTFPYGQIVGSLLYLSVVTRLDIAYVRGGSAERRDISSALNIC